MKLKQVKLMSLANHERRIGAIVQFARDTYRVTAIKDGVAKLTPVRGGKPDAPSDR